MIKPYKTTESVILSDGRIIPYSSLTDEEKRILADKMNIGAINAQGRTVVGQKEVFEAVKRIGMR